MGEGALAGMPLQLAGTRKILEFMDWGEYEAMGTFINIGAIGWTIIFFFTMIFLFILGLTLLKWPRQADMTPSRPTSLVRIGIS